MDLEKAAKERRNDIPLHASFQSHWHALLSKTRYQALLSHLIGHAE
jgi:hypothetical protein